MSRIRSIPQLAELYETYGSVRLYCDTIGEDSAFYLAPIEHWPYLKESFSLWLDGLTENEIEELLPEWMASYVVFGEIPQSGNYLLLPMAGEKIGHVFEFNHDGFEFIERGRDIDDFLGYVSTVTDPLIEDILTYTRYSDGKSDTQWLPSKYIFDESALQQCAELTARVIRRTFPVTALAPLAILAFATAAPDTWLHLA